LVSVGIIANPVSGKDIRRLVAHGSVFDNQEKVRIVRRMLMGLQAVSVDRVFYMPDNYAIVDRAVRGCKVSMEISPVPMKIENNQDDSTRAGRWMEENGVGCIIVLGGDGTCRAVAKGVDRAPLMPVSTGTNNVFPYMVEATVAGLAAGLICCGFVSMSRGAYRTCRLEIVRNDALVDIALVDVATYEDLFVASRAIWDVTRVSEVFLTRCRPESIGLSSIGGQLCTITPRDKRGLHLLMGGGDTTVLAAIAPGLLQEVGIERSSEMAVGELYEIRHSPCVLALDGEREIEVRTGQSVHVRLSEHGPYVVDIARTMEAAQKSGVFVRT
jgi:predicted polyphosphate/ATP-dependent NAD kinase